MVKKHFQSKTHLVSGGGDSLMPEVPTSYSKGNNKTAWMSNADLKIYATDTQTLITSPQAMNLKVLSTYYF